MALAPTHIVTIIVLPFLWDVVIHRKVLYRHSVSFLLLMPVMLMVLVMVVIPGVVI
jgi:hypothetical protein